MVLESDFELLACNSRGFEYSTTEQNRNKKKHLQISRSYHKSRLWIEQHFFTEYFFCAEEKVLKLYGFESVLHKKNNPNEMYKCAE